MSAQILEYHVVPGMSLSSSNLTDGQMLQTMLPGQSIKVRHSFYCFTPYLAPTTDPQRCGHVIALSTLLVKQGLFKILNWPQPMRSILRSSLTPLPHLAWVYWPVRD